MYLKYHVYGSKTWTMARYELRGIEIFEIRGYRRTEKISWTDRTSNDEVLERVSDRKST